MCVFLSLCAAATPAQAQNTRYYDTILDVASFTLIQPILDNKAAFSQLFPGAYYAGDIGDASHSAGPSEHNAWNHEDNRNTPGYVYAQDFGAGGAFDLPNFARWLLDAVRAGGYPEVKYIISRHPANAGTNYFGLFDIRYGWTQQASSGHDHHIHVSYGPYTNTTPSTIIADWHRHQNGTLEDDMPIALTGEIKPGFAIDAVGKPPEEGTIVDQAAITYATIPPSNAGGVPWGYGYLSFGADLGSPVTLRVAVNAGGGWDVRYLVIDPTHDRGGWGQLPDGSGKLSIARIRTTEDDASDLTPIGYLLEYGARA